MSITSLYFDGEKKLEVLKSLTFVSKYIGFVIKHKNNHEPYKKAKETYYSWYKNNLKQLSSSWAMI